MPNKTILFADDSVTMRVIMEKTFAAEPYDVVTVPSGEAAVAKAREIRPDIIIADAGMAGVSGYDVCKSIRDEPNLAGTPIIIMAGVSNPYDESRGKEVGVDVYVKKPFDSTQLLEKVENLTTVSKVPDGPVEEEQPAEEAPEPAASPEPIQLRSPSSSEVSTSTPAVLSSMEQTSRPVAPVRPIQPARPTSPAKETLEFGRASAHEIEPATDRSSAPPAPTEAPEVEPIEVGNETVAQAEPGSFQVSTLAELAQMDNEGQPIQPESHDDAIEMHPSPTPMQAEAPAGQASVESVIEAQASEAAKKVADRVPGVTPEQVEAVRALTAEVIEQVVWEVVPDLAEMIIKEEIAKLLEE